MNKIVNFFAVALVIFGTQQATSFEEKSLFQLFNVSVKMQENWLHDINAYGVLSNPKNMSLIPESKKPFPLFEHYPQVQKSLPRIELGELPTPVKKLTKLGKLVDMPQLYVKQDDLTGVLNEDGQHEYGGNKVRKLEFLLGEALAHGANAVMPFGCIGSNLVMAASVYAHKLGLQSIAMMKPEANSHDIRQNILMHHLYGTKMYYYPNNNVRQLGALMAWLDHKHEWGNYPYLIPTGGSSPVGAVGFVNAALELKKQIDQGLMPKPDYIYVAVGSAGTAAGLALGLKLAQLDATIVAVSTEPEEKPNEFAEGVEKLFKATNDLLITHDASFPKFAYPADKLIVNTHFCGPEYAVFIKEGVTARSLMRDIEEIRLDGTYTAKAFAALLDDAKNQKLKDQVVLFWNTFCGLDFDEKVEHVDYRTLPHFVHDYFQNDVQELDLD